mgnify:CR=1 FL=1
MTEIVYFKSGIELVNHITNRITKLNNRCIILQKKYTIYKIWYDGLNIMIILLSTLLSIIEAFKIRINETENERLIVAFEIIPIFMSSIITCTVAIIRLQKYQENMEFMLISKEKVILTKTKLREIQELIKAEVYDYETIKDKYMKEVYPLYNSCNEDLERNILFKEIVKYEKEIKDEEHKSHNTVTNSLKNFVKSAS